MPTSTDVREQLTDILVRVLACPADAVVPEATLKELGADSLTTVEIGEELGRRFDVYLSDDTIDSLVTVNDAVRAVVHHDGTPSPSAQVSVVTSGGPSRLMREEREKRRGRMRAAALWLGLTGVAMGAVLGLGGAALVSASGLDSVDLPPLTMPTTIATTTPSPSPTPSTPTPTDENVLPDPTLVASSSHVAPGEHIGLSGAFPELGKGATLQVQVKDEGSDWDSFPVDTKTEDGGKFETEIWTSRTGTRKFRMFHEKTGKASPAVTVEIG